MTQPALVSVPRQFLRPLLSIVLTTGPSYGYELTERLRGLGLRSVDTAAVYRMLRTMEREHDIESWWGRSDSGPRRRWYKLTDSGKATARECLGEIVTIREFLGDAIDVAMVEVS